MPQGTTTDGIGFVGSGTKRFGSDRDVARTAENKAATNTVPIIIILIEPPNTYAHVDLNYRSAVTCMQTK
jgi:hypothetical protein